MFSVVVHNHESVKLHFYIQFRHDTCIETPNIAVTKMSATTLSRQISKPFVCVTETN